MHRMRRIARIFIALCASIAALALVLTGLLWLPATRPAVITAAARVLVRLFGFGWAGGDLRFAGHRLSIDGLVIDDDRGEEFLTVRRLTAVVDPAGLIGRSDRRLGLFAIDAVAPHVFLRHRSDGTWNFDRLIPRPAATPAAAAKPVRAAPPWHLRATVTDGEISVVDPQAVVAVGKSFSLSAITGSLDLNQGTSTHAALTSTLRSGRGSAALNAGLYENDRLSYASAVVTAPSIPMAPVIDAFLPSGSFIMEGGRAQVRMLAFAVGYTGSPRWHFTGDATIRAARLQVAPLVLPIRNASATLHFNDGLLTIMHVRAHAGDVPVEGLGAMQLTGVPRLMFVALPRGRLEQARKVFSFTANQDLAGPFRAAVRIDGPLKTIRVAGFLQTTGARYQNVHLPAVRATFYVSGGHVTVGAFDLGSNGARAWLQADFDTTSRATPTQALAVISAPAFEIPVVANLMPAGNVAALVSASGPFSQITAFGYAQALGPGSSIRAVLSGSPRLVAFGPILYRAGGAEALGWADRTLVPSPVWSGELVANHFPLDVRGGRIQLADISVPAIGLPSIQTTLSGGGYVFAGAPNEPTHITVVARAADLRYDGVYLGNATVTAAGTSNSLQVARARVVGPNLSASAGGQLALNDALRPVRAVLRGRFGANLGAFGAVAPPLAPRGRASGDYALVDDGEFYVVGARVTSANASIAGMPIRRGAAYVASSHGNTSMLADVVAAGGSVWAFGTLGAGGAGAKPAMLEALVPRLDLRSLATLGIHGATGTATGFAQLSGAVSRPSIRAAATLDGSYRGIPYDADLDVGYSGGTLHSNASRLTVAGNQLSINGDVSRLPLRGPLSAAHLALRVGLGVGNLSALDRFTGKIAPLTGSYNIDAKLAGRVGDPVITGRVASEVGTIRGVTFDDLAGNVSLRRGEVRLQTGTMTLGTSRFGLNGDATQARFSVSADSPHVDMSDFNDFFGGADVFGGNGAFDIALSSAGLGLAAKGTLALADAALYDYRLGRIDTAFSTSRLGGLHAVISQSGPGGSMQLAGTVGFRSYRGGLPDFATARYGVRAHVSDVQVDEILPLIHREDLGLSGLLNADGVMSGTLHQPRGTVRFELRNGYLRRFPIENFAATLRADENELRLQDATLRLPFLQASGEGAATFAGRDLSGAVTLQAADLSALARDLRLPGKISGSAQAKISLSGTLGQPKATADLVATNASFYGIAADRATLHAAYAPGEVSVGDSSLQLAGGRGRIEVTGALPVQLRPLALGPKDRPLNLAMAINGMDLSVLDPITQNYAKLTGSLSAQASVTGTAGNPVGKGSARIANASVTSSLQTVPLTNGSANFSFENDTITLSRFHASAGSGSIDVAGAAHIVPAVGLRSYAGVSLWSRVNFANTQVNFPNWLSGILNGELSFTRSGATPYLAGNVGVQNATIPFAGIYELAQGGAVKAPSPAQPPGVPPLLPMHTIVYGGGLWGPETHTLTNLTPPTPPPAGFSLPSMNVDLTMQAGNNVRIRGGSSVDLTTRGTLQITGNLQAPELAGQFQAVRGQVGYFDTTFRLVSGTVTFDPTSGLLPTLDATAVTNVPGAQITLTVSGRVDNLQTDLESNPPMARDEIIAALLHTPQVNALTSPGQTQATLVQTAQAYFNAQLSRSLLYPVESALAESLNIESISLIFNQFGELAVEVRTRFTPTVSAVYQSSVAVPVTSAYGMSYRLQDYLALDVLQTSRPDYGLYSTIFNLRYTFE
jgi:hypothetical protein